MTESVLLWRIEDGGGTRTLYATQLASGDLRLEGQDLGPAVAAIFGEGLTEYEYMVTVRAADVPQLLAALDADDDVLGALQELYADPLTPGPATFLNTHSIPFDLWTRVGD